MATQKQQVDNSFGTRTGDVERAEERPARRLRFQIEALEQRITPSTAGDDPIWPTNEAPPPGDPLPPALP